MNEDEVNDSPHIRMTGSSAWAHGSNTRYQCDCCLIWFPNSQGLGSHKNSCKLLQDECSVAVQAIDAGIGHSV
jgi:hypothetical protein